MAYRDVYPATDLVFHGSRDAVEFDFVLRPGGSPGAIGIDVRGADAVTLDGEEVVICTGDDTLRMYREGAMRCTERCRIDFLPERGG